METGNIVLIAASAGLAVLLLNSRTLNWRTWRATVTPLASIIGSGFLVAGPIVSHAAGVWAWAAILGLCAVGYFFGAAIRHNIRHVEPYLDKNPPRLVHWVDAASDLSLSLAYFVSVAYYLNLFAAFALRAGGIVDETWIKFGASAVIGAVGLLGTLRGLGALERVETLAVGIKLALIGGLCVALAAVTVAAVGQGSFAWPSFAHETGIREIKVLLGLVILVQGFETSRYLSAEYDADMRIRTMKYAQWLATAIYLVFMLLATRYFTGQLAETGGETAIIDLLLPVAALVAPAIIVTALASQLSAAVADMNGAGGLLAEVSLNRIRVRYGYTLTALASIGVTWAGNIYAIITYASKAFVLYYGLQCLQAAMSSIRLGGKLAWPRAAIYGGGVALSVVILVFAIPADV